MTLIRPFMRYMSCVAAPFSHSSVSSQSLNLHSICRGQICKSLSHSTLADMFKSGESATLQQQTNGTPAQNVVIMCVLQICKRYFMLKQS